MHYHLKLIPLYQDLEYQMNQPTNKCAFEILFQEYQNAQPHAINQVINEPTIKQYLLDHQMHQAPASFAISFKCYSPRAHNAFDYADVIHSLNTPMIYCYQRFKGYHRFILQHIFTISIISFNMLISM